MRTYNGKKGIVPALQSRVAIRGRVIASAERAYSEQRAIGKLLVASGQISAKDAFGPARAIRADIKIYADDQKLDRDLMRSLRDNEVVIKTLAYLLVD